MWKSFLYKRKFKISFDQTPENQGQEFKCNFENCNKVYYLDYYLKKHLKTHYKESCSQCLYCSKNFCYKSNLIVHEKLHTCEKPYKCDFVNCSLLFRTKFHLQYHIKSHLTNCNSHKFEENEASKLKNTDTNSKVTFIF